MGQVKHRNIKPLAILCPAGQKALLETDLAHMSRRDWIEEYARKELGMAPPKPGQMVNEGDLDEVVGEPVKALQVLSLSGEAAPPEAEAP